MQPFQIYGNLYYVGDSWVCVHIVDTGNGLLMFDAGNCGAQAMLIHAIWELGFNPADVKWLILSHGHVDHFGAAHNVDLLTKRQEMLSGSGHNPFIDKKAWKKYLCNKQDELLALKAKTK